MLRALLRRMLHVSVAVEIKWGSLGHYGTLAMESAVQR